MKKLLLISFIIIWFFEYHKYSFYTKKNNQINREVVLYDKQTVFQLFNREVETQSLTILTPQCVFDNGDFSCYKYIKIFLDANCTLQQTSQIKYDFLFYMSPLYYNSYDSRFDANEITNLQWIFLPYSISCQNNNVCLFVTNFILSYKKWSQVPTNGNNVSLNCNKFKVYSFV